jgi:hypothetical protein
LLQMDINDVATWDDAYYSTSLVIGGSVASFVPTQGLAVIMIWSTCLRMGKGLNLKMATER